MEGFNNKFIQERNRGVAIKELCLHFNIYKSTAYNWIKNHPLIKRTKKRTISVHKIC